jgi:hypothetical protein
MPGRPRASKSRVFIAEGSAMYHSSEARPGIARRKLAGIALAFSLAPLAACSSQRRAESAATAVPSSSPSNRVCAALIDRFVGLAAASGNGATGEPAPAPLAGQWWVRSCSLQLGRGELILHLEGPGWYWVEMEQGDFGLRQQVGLDIEAELAGTVRIGYRAGVVSLWFEPTREPLVSVQASEDLQVHGTNAWGSLLGLLPFVPIRERVAERLSEQATAAFRERLVQGATVTYDLGQDQPDLALEQLVAGATPVRAFEDRASWIVNDRLQLPPGTTHAFGPLTPASEYHLDVVNERGPGLEYRALCARDMPANFDRISSGSAQGIERRALVASGTLLGSGRHAAELHVPGCPFYLVVSPAPHTKATTLADVRLRT